MVLMSGNLKDRDMYQAAGDLGMRLSKKPPAHAQSILQGSFGAGVVTALGQQVTKTVRGAGDNGIVTLEEAAIDIQRLALQLQRCMDVALRFGHPGEIVESACHVGMGVAEQLALHGECLPISRVCSLEITLELQHLCNAVQRHG